MNYLKKIVESYSNSLAELSAIDFYDQLERVIRVRWSEGRILLFPFDLNSSVDDYVTAAFHACSFVVNGHQNHGDGLIISYSMSDDTSSVPVGSVLIPWEYFNEKLESSE